MLTRLRELWDRTQGSFLGNRLAKGAVWSLAGALISRGATLVSFMIVARIVGKESFGELGIIQSTTVMLGVFAGFGMGVTSTKHVAELREREPERAGRIIGLSSVVAIVTGAVILTALLVGAPQLAERALAAPHLSNLLRISGGALVLGAINGAQIGALAGFEAFRTIARVNLAVGVASFPMLAGGAWLFGLEGAVWALVGMSAVNVTASHIALRVVAKAAGVPLGYRGCFAEWPILWRFSLPAVLAASMVGPINWVCNAMLVNGENGYAEMGVYNAASQWFKVLMFLPAVLAQVVQPVLAERLGAKDTGSSRRVLLASSALNAVVVFPIVAVAGVLSPWIMGLYGVGFAEEWQVLVVVLITAGFLAVQVPVGNIIVASGRMWTGFAMNTGWGLAFVALTWLLVDRGALGLAIGRAGAYALHATWTFGFAFALVREHRRSPGDVDPPEPV